MERLGSDYGGWWVPSRMLGRNSICYLAGVGEDVTFDLALTQRFGCEVWALDPTPRSIEFAKSIDEPKFHFLPVGLWSEDADLRFYEPKNPEHVSHSVTNLQGTDRYFTAPCRSVRSIMADLGHTHLDLLKLDIEGAEIAVLENLLQDGPLPPILCVELDASEVPWVTLRRLARLDSMGYICRHIEERNYTFTLG